MKESNNSEAAKVISGAVAGTTVMTLFSYLVSETRDEKFKEPKLLSALVHRLAPQANEQLTQVAGWSIHYTVGFVFATLYSKKWRAEKKATVGSGLILGGISGLFAVVVWRTVFRLHPAPPKINFKGYYNHLLLAHFVFGAFTAIGYRMISAKR